MKRLSSFLKTQDWNPKILQWAEKHQKKCEEKNLFGRGPEWSNALEEIEHFPASSISLNEKQVKILGKHPSPHLKESLLKLSPWRKGPFQYFGEDIDTEWQSWMKFDRLAPHLGDLSEKKLLDVGCGSGYYMMRALEHNPEFVLGVDPSQLFYFQFELFARHLEQAIHFMPVGLEELEELPRFFDVVFCMGILYHRKSPADCIRSLQKTLKPGGKLFLETLTIEGKGHTCLAPWDRYAKMRNVYFLPTDECLLHWVEQFGFKNAKIIDVSFTSFEEQRQTEWMKFESLEDFMIDKDTTAEGYPAPRRTLVVAEAK